MPQKSNIEWTDYTSNPIYVTRKSDGKRGWHCDKPSAGCGHCYAEVLNNRFGTGLAFIEKNAELINFHLNEKELIEIIKLNDRLKKKGEQARLFLCDMTDLFLANHSDEIIDKIFAVMALCPNITFQILTKRAERMSEYCNKFHNYSHLDDLHCWASEMADWLCNIDVRKFENEVNPNVSSLSSDATYEELLCYFDDDYLTNVYLGVSVENQKAADERIPLLLETPAKIRFLSCEPLLDQINLGFLAAGHFDGEFRSVDWVIIGGESGYNSRPCNQEWITKIVKQCQSANVSVFVKQLGSNSLHCSQKGCRYPTKNKKGGDIDEFPKHLQIREFPTELKSE